MSDNNEHFWDAAEQADAKEHVEGPCEATTCPICSHALVIRNGEAICESGICRHRVVEGCCGD